jgi:hypothetical protein
MIRIETVRDYGPHVYRVITAATPLVWFMPGCHSSETHNRENFGWSLKRIGRSRFGRVVVRFFWYSVEATPSA